jgi:nanoRNase/pAp phosphatase (c-di-AMP/oligoRNAs hydrolase)
MFEGLVISHIKEWFDGRVAYSAVSHDEIVAADIPATECEAGMLSNKLKSVPGWDIGIAIIEKEAGKVSLSFRTRDSEKYDLTKIVTALGGGGHKGAAGAKLTDSMQNVLEKVQKLLATTYFQNPNL